MSGVQVGISRRSSPRGFTLVELLVVMGIISVLIGLLMPSLSKAREHANYVNCQSNMRQIGLNLQMYANDWSGFLFPPGLGADRPRENRWTWVVFDGVWNPPFMRCPTDIEPAEEHSYILNDHLIMHKIRIHSTDLAGKGTGEVIVMGEKRSDRDDYYMNENDYPSRVEFYRHGVYRGSNYLFLDWHVGNLRRTDSLIGMDPWDVPVAASQPAG
jgi:prepilin-type N-terminal cleavage/methylation domain-containing protein/prepilin-type processing-associated H-X9-DG protein